LTQAMTVKGAPPPKPRLSGSIVRVLETARPTELRARVQTTHASLPHAVQHSTRDTVQCHPTAA
jgi:hypothetical protein